MVLEWSLTPEGSAFGISSPPPPPPPPPPPLVFDKNPCQACQRLTLSGKPNQRITNFGSNKINLCFSSWDPWRKPETSCQHFLGPFFFIPTHKHTRLVAPNKSWRS
jgi:hypothetical protein